MFLFYYDEVAEWLRRWTANPLGSARVGSNPIFVEFFLVLFSIQDSLFPCDPIITPNFIFVI